MPITWYLNDPWSIPQGLSRFSNYYGFSGTPSAVFDGVSEVPGGNTSSMFSTYLPIVQNRLAVDSPLTMQGAYTLTGLTGSVDVVITVTGTVPAGGNVVRLAVVEDGAHDGEVYLARLWLPEETFALSSPGESVTVHRDFQLQAGWNQDALGVVAWVQHDPDHQVLQCCAASADYAGTVVVDVTPDGLDAGWTLTGPDGYYLTGTDDRTLRVFSTGDYSIVWDAVPGWGPPAPGQQTLTLDQDATITFAVSYTDPPFTALPLADMGASVQAAQGVAVRDVDGDQDLDLYVSASGEPNVWYRNDGAGTWTPVTAGALADTAQDRAAVFLDYDGDGLVDLYLVRHGEPNVLLHNDGAGVWHDATFGDVADAGDGVAAAATDYDGDGLVDLYVVNDGGESSLLHSYGDLGNGMWFFLRTPGNPSVAGPSRAGVWADADGDGDDDLYLVNNFTVNRLYRNDGPAGFNPPVGASVLEDTGPGAAAAWGDYDGDGDLDLYLANDGGSDHLFVYQYGSYSQVLGDAVNDPGHGSACAWGDYDNDGDLDLYLARRGEPDRLLRNEGGGTFTPIPLGAPETTGEATACAWGDVDGDGDLDACVTAADGRSVLLLNNLAGGHHWLRVHLVGAGGNTQAVGARVRVVAGDRMLVQEVTCGGTAAQDPGEPWFGLGDAATVDTLVIRWPDGQEQVLTGVLADRRLTVVQGGSTATPGAPPAWLNLAAPWPNPFNPRLNLQYTLPRDGWVRVAVYDGAGRRVRTLQDAFTAGGVHHLVWQGDDDAGRRLPSGSYLVEVRAAEERRVARVTLVR